MLGKVKQMYKLFENNNNENTACKIYGLKLKHLLEKKNIAWNTNINKIKRIKTNE